MKGLVVVVLVCAISSTVAEGKSHKGGPGHHHGGHGPNMMDFFDLGDEARQKFCKTENINNDKIEQLRTEMAACHKSPCHDQADDVNVDAITGWENKKLVKNECSEKHRTCVKERMAKHHHKRDAEEEDSESHHEKDDPHKKMNKVKECMKKAFEKVYGE